MRQNVSSQSLGAMWAVLLWPCPARYGWWHSSWHVVPTSSGLCLSPCMLGWELVKWKPIWWPVRGLQGSPLETASQDSARWFIYSHKEKNLSYSSFVTKTPSKAASSDTEWNWTPMCRCSSLTIWFDGWKHAWPGTNLRCPFSCVAFCFSKKALCQGLGLFFPTFTDASNL